MTGEHLADEHIDVAYTSNLVRCIDTTRLIIRERDIEMNVRPDLRELSFGEWEGLTYQQISERIPGALERIRDQSVDFCPPGGETWSQMRARVIGVFEEIKRENGGGTVLIVAHINPVRVMLGEVFGSDLRSAFRLRVRNCAVSILQVDGQRSSLVLYNDACHLEGWNES